MIRRITIYCIDQKDKALVESVIKDMRAAVNACKTFADIVSVTPNCNEIGPSNPFPSVVMLCSEHTEDKDLFHAQRAIMDHWPGAARMPRKWHKAYETLEELAQPKKLSATV